MSTPSTDNDLKSALGATDAPGIEDAYVALVAIRSATENTNHLLQRLVGAVGALGVVVLLLLAHELGFLTRLSYWVASVGAP